MKKSQSKTGVMSKLFSISVLVMLFGIGFQIHAHGGELDIPWADPNVQNGVPFENIKTIAQLKADVLWGKVTPGPVIPYSDLDGKVTAYLFTFYIGGQQFPSYQEITKGLTRKASEIHQPENNGKDWQQNFGYIILSATYNQVPIVEYSNHLPQYYLRGEQAKAVAALNLEYFNPELVCIYYGGPLEQWFEFEGGGKSILVDAYSMKPYAKERLIKANNETENINLQIKKRVKEAWNSLERFELSSGYRTLNSNVIDSVPFYTWSYGCTPTASAMLMGYWDERGYGRLVDYFFDHPDVPTQQTIYNVPNVQKELAIEMNTDTTSGGTWGDSVPGGQTRVANNINGYSFSSTLTSGGSWNDWCWNEIKTEIDAGRPFHWMMFGYLRIGPHHGEIDTMYPVNHSVAAIGYIDNGALENDFVIVHDTWNAYVTYWSLYTTYGGNSYSDVATLVPGGANANNVKLTFPVGWEVLSSNSPYNITWTSTGSDIDHCALYYSSNNCQSWETIDNNVPNIGSYTWTTPGTDLENVRIKIDAHSSSRALLADDASRDNFQVATGNASGTDTIAYENYSPYYVDALPTNFNGYPLDHYNVRFTPVDDCSLLAAQFYFARKGGTSWALRVYVWSDNGGLPDQLIDSVDVHEDSIYTRHDDDTLWTRAHFAAKGIIFPKFQDFHIGYSLIGAGPGDSLPVVADYGFTDRSSVYWNGSFVTLHSLTGGGHNFFIDAIVSYDVVEGCEEEKNTRIGTISFGKTYPNPFNQFTTINYQLSAPAHITFEIYDVTGRKVRELLNEPQKAGYYSVTWNGTDATGNTLTNGIYFLKLKARDFCTVRKLLLMR